MFEKIRKPARGKNLASYVIFGLICVIFVFIGVPVDQPSRAGGKALVVNNKVISWSEFQSYLEGLQSQSKPSADPEMEAKRQDRLKEQAVESLLDMELMFQSAHSIGLLASRQAVQESIVAMSLFQEEGRFLHSKYRDFLKYRRFSAQHFENLIQKDIQIRRLQSLFKKSMSVPLLVKEKNQNLSEFQVKVSYGVFSMTGFKPGEMNILKELAQEGKLRELKALMKDKAVEWKTTEVFDLSRTSLPGLDSEKKLFSAFIQHLPKTGLMRKVIQERDKLFVLKVDHFSRKKTKDKPKLPLPFFMDRIQSQMAFYSWIRFVRSSAKLYINPSLQPSL